MFEEDKDATTTLTVVGVLTEDISHFHKWRMDLGISEEGSGTREEGHRSHTFDVCKSTDFSALRGVAFIPRRTLAYDLGELVDIARIYC